MSSQEFPFQYDQGLIWVDVRSDKSSRPLNFLLDTGASVSVLNLETARELGLKLGRKVSVHGVHSALPGFWPQRFQARIDGVSLPVKYLVVDLAELGRACERKVDGLLGADFFHNRVVEIDFQANRVRLLKVQLCRTQSEVVRLKIGRSGMCVPVRVNGSSPLWVRLDTGCRSPLEWVQHGKISRTDSSRVAIGLTGVAVPQGTATVELGRKSFSDISIGVHQLQIFPGESGLLGNGLLSQFSSVIIDAKAQQLRLNR